MKKSFLIAAFMLAGIIAVNAQKGFRFGAGVRLGLPIGDFGDYYSFGVGGEIQGEYGCSEKFSVLATTGYSSFFGKDFGTGTNSYKVDAVGFIPIIAGVRVYPTEQFFIGAQAGVAIFTGNGSSETAFDYQPQIGYNGSNIQVALNYNGASKDGSTNGHIGLTGIYKFGAGNNKKK
jgi:hypothetical protein